MQGGRSSNLRKTLMEKGVHVKMATLIESINYHLGERSKSILLDGSRLVLKNPYGKPRHLGDLNPPKPYFRYHSLHFDEKGEEAMRVFASVFAPGYVDLVVDSPFIFNGENSDNSLIPIPQFDWFTITFMLKSGEISEMKFFDKKGIITAYLSRIENPYTFTLAQPEAPMNNH